MASSSPENIMLQYTKRRYDGGPEIELIQQIELQYQIQEQQRVSAGLQYYAQPHPVAPPAPECAPVEPAPQQVEMPLEGTQGKAPKIQRLASAVLTPFVELTLGVTGLVVGGLMALPIVKKNLDGVDSLKNERSLLLQQSKLVIIKSVVSIIFPWTAIRQALQ